MSMDDLGLIGVKQKTLLIDGDIIVYQPCCIFNEDTDDARRQIARHISNKVDKLMEDAGCSRFMMFVTTKFNFRDQLVDDYKANRVEVERPVNLAWAKRWAVAKMTNFFRKGLEADDLLGIYTGENTVIWSTDKDLRQIPGEHLDEETREIIYVSEGGRLEEKNWVTESGNKRSKIYFEGLIGLYYQMLIGDSTDNIIGCAKREMVAPKTGKNKGIPAPKRVGVGPKAAYNGILKAIMSDIKADPAEMALKHVIAEYKKRFGADWQVNLETQANLLYMVREMPTDDIIKRWTYDGRDEYFHLEEGIIITKEVFLNDYAESEEG